VGAFDPLPAVLLWVPSLLNIVIIVAALALDVIALLLAANLLGNVLAKHFVEIVVLVHGM
jgi:hypothetical protein